MSFGKEIHSYTAQRVILRSPKPISEVIAALDEELNKANSGDAVQPSLAAAQTKDDIDKSIGAITESKRDFIFFSGIPHSFWLSVYFERKVEETWLYTIGNPLIAKEMLQHDLTIGLNVPPRILVQETPGGGTRVLYDLPSAWWVEKTSSELKAAQELLDRKLEAMLRKVLGYKSAL